MLKQSKTIIIIKKKGEGVTVSDSKTFSKAVIIQTAWYWHKNRRKINGKELASQK